MVDSLHLLFIWEDISSSVIFQQNWVVYNHVDGLIRAKTALYCYNIIDKLQAGTSNSIIHTFSAHCFIWVVDTETKTMFTLHFSSALGCESCFGPTLQGERLRLPGQGSVMVNIYNANCLAPRHRWNQASQNNFANAGSQPNYHQWNSSPTMHIWLIYPGLKVFLYKILSVTLKNVIWSK